MESSALGEREARAVLPLALLSPFDAVTDLRWDEATGRGRVAATRVNRVDDWYYSCHFPGDPVMPGCWGVDAVWQCLRYFAAWRGLPPCRPLSMADVRFFGQVRPGDREVEYSVEVTAVEESEGEWLVTGRAEVSVDGCKVYSIGEAQAGTSLWTSEERRPMPRAPEEPRLCEPLGYGQFRARSRFSPAELVAISQGTLVTGAPGELGLLPAGLMLELGRVHLIERDEAAGEGRVVATRENSPNAWFYPMNAGVKPAALSLDAVWQLLGLYLSWRGHLGTGRALGFERLDLFGEVLPSDREVLIEARVAKEVRSSSGDAQARADAKVFADGRLILACEGASVGCHGGIRYAGYPRESATARGGKVKAAGSAAA